MTLVSLSVVVWFLRNRGDNVSAWKVLVAPGISFLLGSLVLGCTAALVIRARDRADYERLGAVTAD